MAKWVNFDYENKSYNQFKKRFDDLKKKYKNNPEKLHKYRILSNWGLDLRTWKKQLQGKNVVDWKNKYDFCFLQINKFYNNLIDIVLESKNEMALVKILEKEAINIYEPEETNTNQPIQIITNSNFELPQKIHIDPVEVKNGTN